MKTIPVENFSNDIVMIVNIWREFRVYHGIFSDILWLVFIACIKATRNSIDKMPYIQVHIAYLLFNV